MPRIEFEGRAFSADRFTAMLWTGLGLFGVHLSKRRGEKKKKNKEKEEFILFLENILVTKPCQHLQVAAGAETSVVFFHRCSIKRD